MNEIDSELADMEAKIKKTEARALKLSHKRQTSLLEKNSAFQKIDDAKLEKTRAESKRESQANRVNEFVEQARKVSERVPVDPGETPGSLDKKLDKLTNDLDRFNREWVLPMPLGSYHANLVKGSVVLLNKSPRKRKKLQTLIEQPKSSLSN